MGSLRLRLRNERPVIRVLERWSPLGIGLAIAVPLTVAFLVTEFAIGRFPNVPVGEGFDAWIAVVHCLLLGAVVGAYVSTERLGRQSLSDLRDNFPQEDESALEYVPAPAIHLALAALLGLVIVGVLVPYLTAPFPWVRSTWTPEVYWHRILGPPLGIFLGLVLYAGTRESVRCSRAATRLKAVDLFAPDRFAPLVRHGLTNGLIGVVLTSVAALFLVDPNQIRAVGPVWAVMLPVMTLGIALPVLGARTRLRQEKQREMAWALEGIRGARAQEPVDTRRLGELSAYYEVVRGAPESPFTQSALVRAALYFLIPAGAWLGAVVLEAILQTTVLGG